MNVQPHPLIVAYRQQLAAQGQYVPPLVSYPAVAPQTVAAPQVAPMQPQYLQQQYRYDLPVHAPPKRPLCAVDDNVIVAQSAPAAKKQKAAPIATAKAPAASVPQSSASASTSKAKTSKASTAKASKPAKAKEESRWPFIKQQQAYFVRILSFPLVCFTV